MWRFILILLSCSTVYWQERVEAQSSNNELTSEDFGSGAGEKPGIVVGSGIEVFRNALLPSTCSPEYQRESEHTMCMKDDNRVRHSGVTESEKRSIVALHNSLRAQVDPPATDLTILTWDGNLAAVANKWAKQCVIGHDTNRAIPSYGIFIGQNVAAGHRSWRDAIMSWYNEVSLYTYGKAPSTYLGRAGWKKIGHYTQMVQNDTYRIGCGFANCRRTNYGRYYVCNYAKGQSKLDFPYTSGTRCSRCPTSCWKGLCDCGGTLCLNQGKLDPDTCTCDCPSIYIGSDCGTLNCPPRDPFYCGRDLLLRDCKVFANVPHLCPYMCGVCGDSADIPTDPWMTPLPPIVTTTPKEDPPFISPFNCTYRGLRASSVECESYGDRGMDMGFCASKGGQFECDDCARYYNIKRDYCPVQCGLCDAPCGGKNCLHGGKLDPRSCICTCTELYSGETCEMLNCPIEEKWHCGILPKGYCKIYNNVPTDCPYLCGICKRQSEIQSSLNY